MSKPKQEITIKRAKGRPMLTWVGKQPLERAIAYPAQAVEQFSLPTSEGAQAEIDWSDWPERYPQGGLLFHGDNKDVLAHLLANGFRGKVKLIYIDPPFDSGADYVRKVQLRGPAGTTKIEGETYTLGEQIQYTDIWANDNYLQFMFERLLMLKELLSEEGSIYLHCDYRKSHHLRMLMDEVFGQENFRNEISWIRTSSHNDTTNRYSRVKDAILFYAKSSSLTFNTQYVPYGEAYLESEWKVAPSGRRYKCENMLDPQGKMKEFDFHGTTARWRTSREKMEALWNAPMTDVPGSHGRIKLGRNGSPIKRCRIVFLDELPGVQLSDNWSDISYIAGRAAESENYPTQKPEKLLERILTASTHAGDLVLDSFCGSGTLQAVAQKLGRRWIGCDINKGAIQTTAKRLQTVMREQAEAEPDQRQSELVGTPDQPPRPAQFGFSTWRVNDYDLQIQHNEAVELACEHIGITRTRSDSFFDGRLGERLVKIIPFNHPLSPLDLDDIDAELKRRSEEQRDVTVVCLGLELAARDWAERHNRNRPINRYHIIELRTDNKYGGFIKHEPLEATVAIQREGDQLQVQVLDVFSPTIMQRLNMEKGVFRAKIDDWRAVVDCILIDTDYNGELFNVRLSDIPARKTDLVAGQYTLPAPDRATTVAVKVIDMLGEELILTERLEA